MLFFEKNTLFGGLFNKISCQFKYSLFLGFYLYLAKRNILDFKHSCYFWCRNSSAHPATATSPRTSWWWWPTWCRPRCRRRSLRRGQRKTNSWWRMPHWPPIPSLKCSPASSSVAAWPLSHFWHRVGRIRHLVVRMKKSNPKSTNGYYSLNRKPSH